MVEMKGTGSVLDSDVAVGVQALLRIARVEAG